MVNPNWHCLRSILSVHMELSVGRRFGSRVPSGTTDISCPDHTFHASNRQTQCERIYHGNAASQIRGTASDSQDIAAAARDSMERFRKYLDVRR